MATFTALNIIPDEHTDDEVDNTKEIQIEEALKLYTTALKLHSQGQEFYDQAAVAYTNLLQSEIFEYPESQTEFERVYKNPELEFADVSFALGLDGTATPSSLPQILYLSYKNHGQFILDCLKTRMKTKAYLKSALDDLGRAAINNFALALVSDESDTELWRRTARIGAMLGSRRVTRYCLEAAVEVDDDPTVSEVEPPSLEEGYSGEQLKELLEVLGDDTALSHPIMAPYMKKTMPDFLKRHMDPFKFLPDNIKTLDAQPLQDDAPRTPEKRILLDIEQRSWAAIGQKLWTNYISPYGQMGIGIVLRLPPELVQVTQLEPEHVDTLSEPSAPPEDSIMEDVHSTESSVAQNAETAEVTPESEKPDDQIKEVTTTTTVPLSDEPSQKETSPTRKRSQSAAGIRESPDEDSGAQKRSKRIRNRDSTLDGPVDPSTQFAEQLAGFMKADEDAFTFVGDLLVKLGVDDLKTLPDLRTALSTEAKGDRDDVVANTAARDLRDILRTWDDTKASTFINCQAADVLGSSAGIANAGLAAFLEHSKIGPAKAANIPLFDEAAGLALFASKIDSGWMPLQDVIWEWICVVLPTYSTHLWSSPLKDSVACTIGHAHVEIFRRLQVEMDKSLLKGGDLVVLEEMAETLFELSIDIYAQITHPKSIVELETRVKTKDQLDRCADMLAEVMRRRPCDMTDKLLLRYLWASVFYATMSDVISRDHKVLCWTDLQVVLRNSGKSPIELQNNAVMPEISIEAAEREVSRLTTMDFFFNLFQTDKTDPISIIETLEPVLDPDSARQNDSKDGSEGADGTDNTPQVLKDMWKFLASGSTSLRLFLWQRLREAYFIIGYNTKVFSCHLKSIEIIVSDFRTSDYIDSPDELRRHKLLVWLKTLDELLVKSLTIALNDAATCFEIIDDRHIKSTCAALAQLTRVLHSAAVFDDEVRVGMINLPQSSAYSAHGSFNTFISKLREMQVRTWALQYTMIKDAMTQNRELFLTPDNDLVDYLAFVHYALGLRKCCKASNKIFLKMMKVELIRMKNVDRWEDCLGQVLFDLYNIKLGVGAYLLDDHGCPTEQLDRRTVMSIAEQVISLANRMPLKDLLKHELRSTIERMQTAVGQNKASIQMTHNLRNYTEYLKTSIRPLDLYKAWKGQVEVDSLPVNPAESGLANKKWYFLLGMINLTKFRSQKRLGPGAQTDELKISASFFRIQLQYTADHWETWYRLAQCFDHELEEEIMFSADKINNHRSDLVRMQRSAIHCYVMALSTAIRCADDSFATSEKLSEMYYDFGMRLYSSSRDPFRMEAFWLDDFEKHMSGASGMYKKPLHEEMTRYRVWKYAARLFRESRKERPKHWMTHFMLGKCYWKMFCQPEDEYNPNTTASKPTMDLLLDTFANAATTVPKPRDSRQEPILEPHYKLVSVVHKLVMMRAMKPQAASDFLQQQPYAVRKGETISIEDAEEWDSYILSSLRNLRSMDKQHWHHRMVARAVAIHFDEHNPEFIQANAAKLEFRESIFTKTMHIQVWKPESERPGRHCVYMERYVRLMVKLLFITNDKANLEALVKRVRKKANDFFMFSTVWTDCCTTYLRLIRRTANITASTDEVFKGVPSDEFEMISDRLATWIVDPSSSHPALDALRETSELKKLNASAMKPAPIDDLINDAWGVLYLQVGKTLPGPERNSLEQAQLDGDAGASAAPPPRPVGPMNLANLVMDMNGTQIPVPITLAGSEPTRPRKVGIARREVLRQAEQAINRAPDTLRNIAPANSRSRIMEPSPSLVLGSNDGLGRSVSASISTPTPDHAENQNGTEHDNDNDNEQEENEDANEDENEHEHENGGEHEEHHDHEEEEESEKGSVHDSADDESDLSDVPDMDNIDAHMIFPNLVRSVQTPQQAESSDSESGEEVYDDC